MEARASADARAFVVLRPGHPSCRPGTYADHGARGHRSGRARRLPPLRGAAAAPRSDVLHRDPASAWRRASRGARAVRLRARSGRHRRRAWRRSDPPRASRCLAGRARARPRRRPLGPSDHRRPRPRRAALRPPPRRAARLHGLDARRLRSRPHGRPRRPRRVHERQRRRRRPHHGAAARRTRGRPGDGRGARRRLPAHELHPRRPRGLGDGPDLPPGPGRGRPRGAARERRVPRTHRLGGRAGSRAVRRHAIGHRRGPPRDAHRHADRAARSTSGSSTVSSASASTSSAGGPRSVRSSSRAR